MRHQEETLTQMSVILAISL